MQISIIQNLGTSKVKDKKVSTPSTPNNNKHNVKYFNCYKINLIKFKWRFNNWRLKYFNLRLNQALH